MIRKINDTDIFSVCQIVRKNYSNEESLKSFAELKRDFNRILGFVIQENNKIIGFCCCMQCKINPNLYSLYKVNIDPEYQNLGYGRYLIKYVIDELNSSLLLVTVIPKFYEQFGFTKCFTIEDDLILMLLNRYHYE